MLELFIEYVIFILASKVHILCSIVSKQPFELLLVKFELMLHCVTLNSNAR
jgi:hypothetical protein